MYAGMAIRQSPAKGCFRESAAFRRGRGLGTVAARNFGQLPFFNSITRNKAVLVDFFLIEKPTGRRFVSFFFRAHP